MSDKDSYIIVGDPNTGLTLDQAIKKVINMQEQDLSLIEEEVKELYEITNPYKGSLEECLMQKYKSEPLSGREKRRLRRKKKRKK